MLELSRVACAPPKPRLRRLLPDRQQLHRRLLALPAAAAGRHSGCCTGSLARSTSSSSSIGQKATRRAARCTYSIGVLSERCCACAAKRCSSLFIHARQPAPHATPSPPHRRARTTTILAGRALRVVGHLGCGRVCLRTQRDGRQPPAQTVLSDFIVHVESTLHTYSSTPL